MKGCVPSRIAAVLQDPAKGRDFGKAQKARRESRASPAGRGYSASTVMVLRFDCVSGSFGRVTVNTPFLKVALT